MKKRPSHPRVPYSLAFAGFVEAGQRQAHGVFKHHFKKLYGEPALLRMNPAHPHLVLAQFDNMEGLPFWSHGWHPLPASSFADIHIAHDWRFDACICKACGIGESEELALDLEEIAGCRL